MVKGRVSRMRKPGTDESNVQPSDVLCDYCGGEWGGTLAMIEGHQGSCICGKCLTVAYTEVVMHKIDGSPGGVGGLKCTMCLEVRDEAGWLSPMVEDKLICKRCIKQAAGALHKSKDFDWRKPDAPVVAKPAVVTDSENDEWEEEPDGGWADGDSDEFEYDQG